MLFNLASPGVIRTIKFANLYRSLKFFQVKLSLLQEFYIVNGLSVRFPVTSSGALSISLHSFRIKKYNFSVTCKSAFQAFSGNLNLLHDAGLRIYAELQSFVMLQFVSQHTVLSHHFTVWHNALYSVY